MAGNPEQTVRTLTRAQVFRQHQIPLDVVHVRQHGETVRHRHEFSELVIVLRGTGIHVSPAGEYPIGAGDVFVLHGDEEHGYTHTQDLELVNLLFYMDELGVPRYDIASLPGFHVLFTLEPRYRQRDRFESRLRLTPEQLHQVATLVARLEQELERRDPGWGFVAVGYFMLIVAELSRFYSRVDRPAAQPLLRLGRVISYLERHYAEPIRVSDLAEVGGLSPRTLSRIFRDAYGCSPIEYLIRLRIRHALDLLRDPHHRITDVALQVGFNDSNYFSRQFRAVVGQSPRRYRAGLAESLRA